VSTSGGSRSRCLKSTTQQQPCQAGIAHLRRKTAYKRHNPTHPPMQYIKPVDVARQLGIADPTLRRYCTDFAKHLSSDAAPDDAGTRRRCRLSDVAVLRRAKELLDMGNTIEGVNDLLGLDDFSTAEAEKRRKRHRALHPPAMQHRRLCPCWAVRVIAAQADRAQRLSRQDGSLASCSGQIADLRAAGQDRRAGGLSGPGAGAPGQDGGASKRCSVTSPARSMRYGVTWRPTAGCWRPSRSGWMLTTASCKASDATCTTIAA
jgi:DNA-binding transcriptional MerR regulator